MKTDISKILLSEEVIKARVAELGKQISKDYKGKNLHLISVLKGSVVFTADLMRKIDIPLTLDFIAVSSYGAGTKTTGTVTMSKDLSASVEGKDVLIVEDIIDTGITLSYLVELLKKRNANSVKLCTLLNKPSRRHPEITLGADYEGFVIPDEFVVGYGVDYDEKYRNLPYIGVADPKIYSK